MPIKHFPRTRRKADQRLALLALAAADEPPVPGPCLEPEELSLLVEGKVVEKRARLLRTHLAACETCHASWLLLSLDATEQRRGAARPPGLIQRLRRLGILTAAGSALAAAAGVALFLSTIKTPEYKEAVAPSTVMVPARPMVDPPMAEAPASEGLARNAAMVATQSPEMEGPRPLEPPAPRMAESVLPRKKDVAALPVLAETKKTRVGQEAPGPGGEEAEAPQASALREASGRDAAGAIRPAAKEAVERGEPPSPGGRREQEKSLDRRIMFDAAVAELLAAIEHGCKAPAGQDYWEERHQQAMTLLKALLPGGEGCEITLLRRLLPRLWQLRQQGNTSETCPALLDFIGRYRRGETDGGRP